MNVFEIIALISICLIAAAFADFLIYTYKHGNKNKTK
jgi:hypothetical protein